MKKLIICLLLFLGITITAGAKDYVAQKKAQTEFTDSTTADTYTINSIKYNVYRSKKGAFYIWKTSKLTGKKYRYYLPKHIQVQMGRIYREK